MGRRIKPHDLLTYRFLSSPRFSPDGRYIAFAVHRMDLSDNTYLSDLWIHDLVSNSTTRLTTSGAEKGFCWSRDSLNLFFISDRPDGKKEKDPKTARLFRISVVGGEAELLGTLPQPVSALWDVGEGRFLLKMLHEAPEPHFEDADYMVFKQVPFCSNGKGFTGQRRSQLALYEVATQALATLSPDGMDVGQVRLSDDSQRAWAVGPIFTDLMPETTAVWEFDLGTKTGKEVLPQGKFAYTCAWENDGALLLTATDMKAHGHNENAKFYVYKDGTLSCLTPDIDRGLRNSVICDCRYGGTDMNLAFWGDSGKAWFVSTDGYHSHLHTLDLKGNLELITQNLRAIDDYDIKKGKAAVVGLEGLELEELYLIEEGKETKLTQFNTQALEDCELSVPEYVHLENGTPWGLDCWYMRPVDFKIGKKYPTILHIHGGPKMTFGDVFVHEMQCWAAEGYAVLFCNPRGSDGKGNGFDDIRGQYGTVDYEDLMAFVDWAVETLPFVDKDRLGVTGGSYGGFMTNWIIGHTDRFQAAISQRGICNWVSMAGISDIGYFFVPDQQAADIWSDVDKLWWHSPLKYADQIRTPTLIIHSDEDHRCEISQGLQMFTALKRNGVESKICVFKGENHELSRSGRPKPRLARLQEILQWFKEWL